MLAPSQQGQNSVGTGQTWSEGTDVAPVLPDYQHDQAEVAPRQSIHLLPLDESLEGLVAAAHASPSLYSLGDFIGLVGEAEIELPEDSLLAIPRGCEQLRSVLLIGDTQLHTSIALLKLLPPSSSVVCLFGAEHHTAVRVIEKVQKANPTRGPLVTVDVYESMPALRASSFELAVVDLTTALVPSVETFGRAWQVLANGGELLALAIVSDRYVVNTECNHMNAFLCKPLCS